MERFDNLDDDQLDEIRGLLMRVNTIFGTHQVGSILIPPNLVQDVFEVRRRAHDLWMAMLDEETRRRVDREEH